MPMLPQLPPVRRGALLLATLLLPGLDPAVRIRGATPEQITAAFTAELEPQGYRLERANKKEVLYILDGGVVAQNGGGFLHLFTDLKVRYRPQRDSTLEVGVSQVLRGEVVGNRMVGFQRPVNSRESLQKLQHLAEVIRDRVEAELADSAET